MKQHHFDRSRYARIMSYDSFVRLDGLVQSTQTFPENCKIPTSKFFNGTKPANLLTTIAVFWIKRSGGHAYRNTSTGSVRKQRDGSYKLTPNKSMKGSADIMATINGRTVAIEVKIGRDKMSEHQIKFRDQITAAGGSYFVIKSFDDLLAELETIKQPLT